MVLRTKKTVMLIVAAFVLVLLAALIVGTRTKVTPESLQASESQSEGILANEKAAPTYPEEEPSHSSQSERTVTGTPGPNVPAMTSQDAYETEPVADDPPSDTEWEKLLRDTTDAPLLTNLLPDEAERAFDTITSERETWAQLRSLSADVVITVDANDVPGQESLSIQGSIDVKVSAPGASAEMRRPQMYSFELSDANKTWTVRSDGTARGTEVSATDADMANKIRSLVLNGQLFQLFTMPRDLLLPLYKDEFYRAGRHSQEFAFSLITPWSHPAAAEKPGAFVFQNKLTPNSNFIAFEDGHMSEWVCQQEAGRDAVRASYGSYPKGDAFPYPTNISLDAGENAAAYSIDLSQVRVERDVNR